MRRILLVVLGWTLIVIGAAVTPMPVPIPMIGLGPLLLGCAILTANSKSFRRGLARLRYRFHWLSRHFDQFAERGPAAIRHMVRRTRPMVLMRHARMRARKRVPDIGDPVR
ncbi:MAG: hypothetical protein JOZ72_08720 [Alphaproteobacteria bacterium]|nr:hypothetical protein [Alphaproteobacteria bacterium]